MCVMWAFFAGEKAKLEAERERLVHLKELETQKQQAEELRHLVMKNYVSTFLWVYESMWINERLKGLWIVQGKERIARALDGMGCRRTRVVLTELLQRSFRNSKRKRRKTFEFRHLWRPAESNNKFVRFKSRFFSAWGALYDKAKLDQMYRLEHNEQMLKYSQCLGTWINNDRIEEPFVQPRFMLGQKFRKDSKVIIVTVLSFHAISIDFLSLFQSPPLDSTCDPLRKSTCENRCFAQFLCFVILKCF